MVADETKRNNKLIKIIYKLENKNLIYNNKLVNH